MLFVGVDLTCAFSARPRPVDIAVLDASLKCSFDQAHWPDAATVIARDPEALWRMIGSCIQAPADEQVWAIDGPQGLAAPGAKVRRCEVELRTPGRTPDVLPPTDSGMPFSGYIRSSVDLFAGLLNCHAAFQLGGLGDRGHAVATLLEVYPGAEWAVLSGKRLPGKATKGGKSARRFLFERLGVKDLPVPPTTDQNDALVGAYLAWCTRHRAQSVRLVGAPARVDDTGMLREGMILHATTLVAKTDAASEDDVSTPEQEPLPGVA
jgi:hypothetical protein